MKVTKKINNNVAVCLDNNGDELVAFGKGIGFPEMPYALTDMSKVEMTFYRLNTQNFLLLKDIPEKVIEISAEIVKLAQQKIKHRMNPNLIFSLADHINFAIIRQQNYQKMKLPFSYDIQQLYPVEFDLGKQSVKEIRKKLSPSFPDEEAVAIATHFVNSQEIGEVTNFSKIIDEIIKRSIMIIEEHFHIKIDERGFAYNRFVMHLRYYLKRIQESKQITDGSSKSLIAAFRSELPEVYQCTKDIVIMIDGLLNSMSTDDEMFYLMIYVKRVISKSQ